MKVSISVEDNQYAWFISNIEWPFEILPEKGDQIDLFQTKLKAHNGDKINFVGDVIFKYKIFDIELPELVLVFKTKVDNNTTE